MRSKSTSLVLAVVLGCSMYAVQAADAPARPSTFKQVSDTWKKEGLQPVKAAGLELVFVRKDARLDGYSKVLLKPPVVEVNPDWRNKSGMGGKAPVKVKPVIEQITAMLQEEAGKAPAAGGYERVQEPGKGVVTVELTLFHLFLIATEDSVSRGNGIDGRSVGRTTLVADVRDSRSGELILRTFDDEVGPKPEQLMRDAVAECLDWARSAMAGWSSALRGGPDISSGRKSQVRVIVADRRSRAPNDLVHEFGPRRTGHASCAAHDGGRAASFGCRRAVHRAVMFDNFLKVNNYRFLADAPAKHSAAGLQRTAASVKPQAPGLYDAGSSPALTDAARRAAPGSGAGALPKQCPVAFRRLREPAAARNARLYGFGNFGGISPC